MKTAATALPVLYAVLVAFLIADAVLGLSGIGESNAGFWFLLFLTLGAPLLHFALVIPVVALELIGLHLLGAWLDKQPRPPEKESLSMGSKTDDQHENEW